MGFESSQVARRRLALVAARNGAVQDALHGGASVRELLPPLEGLAREILGTPGAGGALLAAYASQARALSLVLEAAQRGADAPLPATVVRAVQQALTTVFPIPAIPLGSPDHSARPFA